MKKILFLFLLAGVFILSSCSNDDDGTSPGGDPIIGTWVLVEMNPSGIIDPMACEENPSTLTFNEDGTGTASFYLDRDNCEEARTSGTWENDGDLRYTIQLPDPIGRQQGEVQFQGEDRFHFTTSALGTPISLTFNRQE